MYFKNSILYCSIVYIASHFEGSVRPWQWGVGGVRYNFESRRASGGVVCDMLRRSAGFLFVSRSSPLALAWYEPLC